MSRAAEGSYSLFERFPFYIMAEGKSRQGRHRGKDSALSSALYFIIFKFSRSTEDFKYKNELYFFLLCICPVGAGRLKEMSEKKGTLFLCFLLFLLMFLIPFLSLTGGTAKRPEQGSSENQRSSSAPSENGDTFQILDTKSGKILSVDGKTFLCGAVAAEMSPLSPDEALKAQAVASYTYYSRLRENRKKTPDPSLKGADFSADPENWQTYVPVEEMKKRWGKDFTARYQKLSAAADSVYGLVLTYGGELIEATYFAISSGNTESSENVWGSKRPYLVSVASPMDVFAGGYQTTVTYPPEEMRDRTLKTLPKANLSSSEESWVGSVDRSPAGTVKSISLGGQSMTGNQAREAFNLRSANFTIAFSGGKFLFTVKGYGHGVGMSQSGAEEMANQGSNYRAILNWYYPSAVITTL